jgi:hypothetical protein
MQHFRHVFKSQILSYFVICNSSKSLIQIPFFFPAPKWLKKIGLRSTVLQFGINSLGKVRFGILFGTMSWKRYLKQISQDILVYPKNIQKRYPIMISFNVILYISLVIEFYPQWYPITSPRKISKGYPYKSWYIHMISNKDILGLSKWYPIKISTRYPKISDQFPT